MDKSKKNIMFEVFFNLNELRRGFGFLMLVSLFLFFLGVKGLSNFYTILSLVVIFVFSKVLNWLIVAKFEVEITDSEILIKKEGIVKKNIKMEHVVRATVEDFKYCSFFTLTYGEKTPYHMTKFCVIDFKSVNLLKTKTREILIDFTGKNIFQIMIETYKASKTN